MATLIPEHRSALMSRIRGKDTGIEMLIRKGLHRSGFRYRLGGANLPGRPDIVLPKYHVVVYVHGCFWHGHNCALYRLPKTNREFWRAKISANRARDARTFAEATALGWKALEVWECRIRGKSHREIAQLIEELADHISAN